MSAIGLAILSFFIVISSILSAIITGGARLMLFADKLSRDDLMLLTIIFAASFALIFVKIIPIRLNGERKKEGV